MNSDVAQSMLRPDFINFQFDGNKTGALGDSTKNHLNARNQLISVVAEVIKKQWDPNYPPMSYKEHIQTVVHPGDKNDKKNKELQEKKIERFLEDLKDIDNELYIKANKKYKKLEEKYFDPETKQIKFTIFPSITKLVDVAKSVCPFSVTLRTFGPDGDRIAKEFAGCGVEMRRHATMLREGVVFEGEEGLKSGPELLKTLQEANTIGQDQYKVWSENKFKASYGKVIPCVEDGQFEGKMVLTIFLDDNLAKRPKIQPGRVQMADPEENNIAYPKDIYGRAVSWNNSKGFIGVTINPLKAALKKNYVINKVNKQLVQRGFAPFNTRKRKRDVDQISSKLPLGSEETKWQGPFSFVQMADCQLGFFDNDASCEKEVILLEKTVEKINRLNPRFVILCGDITNARPHQPQYEGQIASYKKVVSKIHPNIPLICLCGNHDVGDRPTVESIKSYKKHFGSHFFSFWVGGVHCIALNSSLLKDPTDAPELAKKQIKWLEKELFASYQQQPKHRFIFAHHSWFLFDPNEEDSHFNIPKAKRLKILELFEKIGTTACFSGHYHANAYGEFGKIKMITTGAVGKPLQGDVSGFRKVTVNEEGIEHEYLTLEG